MELPELWYITDDSLMLGFFWWSEKIILGVVQAQCILLANFSAG